MSGESRAAAERF